MKKKIILLGSIVVVILSFVYLLMPVPVYLYIDKIYINNNITIHIHDGSGHYKYQKYELIKLDDGIYQMQGYGSLLLGVHYPVAITVLDDLTQIKEIKQKNPEGKWEFIYKK